MIVVPDPSRVIINPFTTATFVFELEKATGNPEDDVALSETDPRPFVVIGVGSMKDIDWDWGLVITELGMIAIIAAFGLPSPVQRS